MTLEYQIVFDDLFTVHHANVERTLKKTYSIDCFRYDASESDVFAVPEESLVRASLALSKQKGPADLETFVKSMQEAGFEPTCVRACFRRRATGHSKFIEFASVQEKDAFAEYLLSGGLLMGKTVRKCTIRLSQNIAKAVNVPENKAEFEKNTVWYNPKFHPVA